MKINEAKQHLFKLNKLNFCNDSLWNKTETAYSKGGSVKGFGANDRNIFLLKS